MEIHAKCRGSRDIKGNRSVVQRAVKIENGHALCCVERVAESCAAFYLVMVSATVALCVMPAVAPVPVPVMVIDPVPVFGPPPPPQPAIATNTSIAATMPKRGRNRCVIGIINSNAIPRTRNTTCRMDAVGGVLIDSGGAMNDTVAVTDALTIVPVFALAGTVQDETFADRPVQLKFTMPLNPCNPVIVTGIEPAIPLIRLAVAGAVTLKSPVAVPVPVSATLVACGVPFAISNVAAS